jgi:hypothetical protein
MLRPTWPMLLRLSAVGVTVGAGCMLSEPGTGTVVLEPGQDIQAIVADSPAGTRFVFEPGIYRQQTIYPNDRQEFIGQEGVILNGAMELTSWTNQSGFWQHADLPAPLSVKGQCEIGWELCDLREDLFFNGRPYQRVATLDELGAGRWYYEDGRAYLADDPTGQAVELSVTPRAIGGDADDVVLENLIVEKYASMAQHGAIDSRDGHGWLIANVAARWNHGVGLYVGSGTHVRGGTFSHNGQLGMGGSGDGFTVEGAEIAFNNYAGYDSGWEAGGAKFVWTKAITIRGSCIHHNNGKGLWTDIDNVDVLIEKNKVFLNTSDGIKHEISYGAIIRHNISGQNGRGWDNWMWGSQILVQNSQNVEVHDNVVEVANSFGNGISVVHQDRGAGEFGPWHAVNNYLHDNTIVHLGDQGHDGIVTDTDDDWFWRESNNRFDRNTYIVPDGSHGYWRFDDAIRAWDEIQALGYEQDSELIVERRSPMALSCDPQSNL